MSSPFDHLGSHFRLRRPLWRHQTEALGVAASFLQERRGRYLFQLPTGSGKGLLIRYIAYLWLACCRASWMMGKDAEWTMGIEKVSQARQAPDGHRADCAGPGKLQGASREVRGTKHRARAIA
jgi:hypothetical protein